MLKKIAIVGTSGPLTDNEERDIRQYIALILKSRYDPSTDMIISGGAKGVDSIAIEIAKGLGFQTDIDSYKPKEENWLAYRARNMKIAMDCNELHCFTVPVHTKKCYHHKPVGLHQKTAGCFTMNEVLRMDKPAQLVVVPQR